MSQELTAAEIKKAILDEKTRPAEPVETAKIFGIEAWLFRASSYAMEGWRIVANSEDPEVRKLGPAKLIQISLRDRKGNPVFEELDLPVIGGMPDAEINRIFKRCLAINGYGGEGIEAILKNLIAIVGIDGVYASLVNINAPCPNCTKDTALTSCESNGPASDIGRPAAQPRSTGPSSPEKSPRKE